MNNIINEIDIETILASSRASVEDENLIVSQENDDIVRSLLKGKISNEEANRLILKYHGISEDITNKIIEERDT